MCQVQKAQGDLEGRLHIKFLLKVLPNFINHVQIIFAAELVLYKPLKDYEKFLVKSLANRRMKSLK